MVLWAPEHHGGICKIAHWLILVVYKLEDSFNAEVSNLTQLCKGSNSRYVPFHAFDQPVSLPK